MNVATYRHKYETDKENNKTTNTVRNVRLKVTPEESPNSSVKKDQTDLQNEANSYFYYEM